MSPGTEFPEVDLNFCYDKGLLRRLHRHSILIPILGQGVTRSSDHLSRHNCHQLPKFNTCIDFQDETDPNNEVCISLYTPDLKI